MRNLDIVIGLLGIAMGVYILASNAITQTIIVTSMIIVFSSFTLIAIQLIVLGIYIAQRSGQSSFDPWGSMKHGTGLAFIAFGIAFQIMAIVAIS